MSTQLPSSWTGAYAYDPIEGIEIDPPPVSFSMEWKLGWFGRFIGTVNDAPDTCMPETGKIKGRVRGTSISFTKYMPVETIMNPDGSSFRTNNPHRPIHYYGDYDAKQNRLIGKWYIAPFSNADEEFDGSTGTWTATPA